MRAGKNEAGDHLCERLGFKGASFASPVKEIFCRAFGVDMDFVETWKVRKEPPPGFKKNVRQSLQFIGDGFRSINPNVWVEYAFENTPKFSCFTDGRYVNELAEVRSNGGVNVLVWRPGHENDDSNESEAQIKRVVDWFVSSKVPEGRVSSIDASAPDGCRFVDFFLVNDGDVADLRIKLDEIVLPEVQTG
jgi:hypothetical protein